ncbi:winged helix-turn-helix domain-containing protein [Prevotella sp. 10(H)]|uniref:winged helix-turn-helix domain-containing protein n=1 Tax=Prevotella sp. 10(H) TaxID=1158294 RepID=UPI0004A6B673|nr:winged helix-turn-helix domain-containing protein [Prevotella sp. 10(H)]
MIDNAIGVKAGDIWQLLSSKGSLSVRQIGDHTHYKDSLILLAVGWLSRENKVQVVDRNGALYIELRNIYPETFY